MKTPREILLERHQAAVPKLDTIRHKVFAAELNNRETKEQSQPANFVTWLLCCSNKFWQELIWPCRRIWAGLAAVWILIFAFNLSQRDPAERMAQKSPTPSPQMILTFRQQERLLTELIGPDEARAAESTTPFLPQPRSERRVEILMV